MKFLTQTFSARKTYQIKVTFSEATSVKLMSKRNLDKYRKSQTHTYWGGHFDNSPVIFNIPNDGQWAVVVEKGTYHAPKDITASVEVITGGELEATALPGGGSVAPLKKQLKNPLKLWKKCLKQMLRKKILLKMQLLRKLKQLQKMRKKQNPSK